MDHHFNIFLVLLGVVLFYLLLRFVYRLTLHPLAKFPGPFLARCTSAYGMWYDLPESSSYCKQFPELHKKYGPIVRIFPNELHILDLDAFNQIFRPGTPFDKWKVFYNHNGTNGFFNIENAKVAKPWRDRYLPYFSKGAIVRTEPLIHSSVKKFVSVLKDAANDGRPVDLSRGFRTLTSDIVLRYSFADDAFKSIEAEGFKVPALESSEQFFKFAMPTLYFSNFFSWLTRNLENLSIEQQMKWVAPLAHTNFLWLDCQSKVKRALDKKESNSSIPTVFDTWANEDKKEDSFTPSLRQISCDAFTFHGAGTDTTAHVLTMGTWYLMHDAKVSSKLREELKTAIPDANTDEMLSVAVLENLPYLRAVVKESLRFAGGPPGRLPRVVPATGAVLCGERIPPKTVVSSGIYSYTMNEDYFKEPTKFIPERWLGPDAPELEQKLLSFSKGSRSCIGINLAYAELYSIFAYLFRNLYFTPYNTTADDMDWKDCFVYMLKKHLEVNVSVVDDEQ